MSILKAVLLTLLITLIEFSIQAISFIGFDLIGIPYDLDHLFGITIILCRIVAYGTTFYFFWRKDIFSNGIELPEINPKILIYILLMTLGFRFIGEPFWDFNQIFRSAEITVYHFKGIDANFIYRNISALLIAPLVEELFFRKFLITKLLKKYSITTTIITSAVLFAAIHWETVSNLLPSFIFGIIAGIIFIRTKKIIYLIILHFLYNFLGMIIHLNSRIYSEIIQWLNFNILYWSLFVLGIFIILFTLRQINSEADHDHSIQ